MNQTSQRLKEAAKEIIIETTAHGIPNVIKTKRFFIKVMWVFSIACSVCFCGIFTAKSIADYLEFNFVTSIQIFNEEKSEFPMVTLCGLPNYNLNLKDILVDFSFGYDPIYNKNPLDFFDTLIDPFHGVCYRFNGDNKDRIYSRIAGRNYGLTMQLALNQKYDIETMFVFIHNQTEKPVSLFNKGYRVLSGSFNYFPVEKVFNYRLAYPYNNCLKDPLNEFNSNRTIINYFYKNKKPYSQKECIPLCRNFLGLKNYKCTCNSSYETADLDCIIKPIYNSLFNKSVLECYKSFEAIWNDTYQNCIQNYCPQECDSLTYEVSPYSEVITASGNFNKMPDYMSNLNRNFTDYEHLKRSFISINVFYPKLKYTVIEQDPKMNLSDLVSNVGGILGLFLGVSFLTFVELIELVAEILCIIFKSNIIFKKSKIRSLKK